MTVVSVAVVGVIGSITTSASLADANRETSLAYRAAQRTIERIQGSTFDEVWCLYNEDDADDPTGVAAPGCGFDIAGLTPIEDDTDGQVGHISFPISIGAGPSITLLDDLEDPDFDLATDRPTRVTNSYDDDVDVADAVGIDPSRGYLLLPIRVEIEWAGVSGDRSIAIETILAPN